MDFKTVLNLLIEKFNKEQIDYALIGGFAMGALGVPRSTIDLDFLVNRHNLSKIERIMQENGYKCAYKTENVSQYISAVKIFGEVDFIHAFRHISISMLRRAIEKDIFGGEFKIRVLRPEDIIGLKLQAMANDHSRTNREYVDIEELISYHRTNIDWAIIEEYFSIFEYKDKLIELKRKYGDTAR